jgi:hypothetical protein
MRDLISIAVLLSSGCPPGWRAAVIRDVGAGREFSTSLPEDLGRSRVP